MLLLFAPALGLSHVLFAYTHKPQHHTCSQFCWCYKQAERLIHSAEFGEFWPGGTFCCGGRDSDCFLLPTLLPKMMMMIKLL